MRVFSGVLEGFSGEVWVRRGLGLLFGVMGGAVAAWWGLPLAWMLGALMVTAFLSLSGVRLGEPGRLREWMIGVIAVMLGGAVRQVEWVVALGWWWAFLGLAAAALVMGMMSYGLLKKVGKFGRREAALGAMPGGITEMIALARERGGDDRLVVVAHATRIMVMVLTIPLVFRYVLGAEVPATARAGVLSGGVEAGLWDMGVYVLCIGVGGIFGRALRLPAARFVGPMILSVAAGEFGLAEGSWPGWLVAGAQVVLGVGIGVRFVGLSTSDLGRAFTASTLNGLMLAVLAWFAALAMGLPAGFSVSALTLAFAPGGFVEMTLIAAFIGLEAAFVSTMHIARLLMTLASLSFVEKWIRAKEDAEGEWIKSRD